MASNQNKITEKMLSVYKPVGLTPLQTLNLLREKYPAYKDEKLTYAGRLDPLAEGVMLVVVGEEVKNKEVYLGLDKEYEAEILFGVATDTGDVLGIPSISRSNLDIEGDDLANLLPNFVGKFVQEYPKFSSPKIAGKDNFSKEVEIKSLELVAVSKIKTADLQIGIEMKIAGVDGDFRQSEILPAWAEFFAINKQPDFMIAKIKIATGSGVYIRVLAEKLGAKLGVPALAYHILRNKVGNYPIDTSVKLD